MNKPDYKEEDMPNDPPAPEEVRALRDFIDENLILIKTKGKFKEGEKALKEIENQLKTASEGERISLEAKRKEIIGRYLREPWLEKKAEKASKIFRVTHATKFTHSSAVSEGIYLHAGSGYQSDTYIGTHSLGEIRTDDYVYDSAGDMGPDSLLGLVYQGEPLRKRFLDRDPVLIAALSDDSEKAKRWVDIYAGVDDDNRERTSHTLSRQVYFPLRGDTYHLLAPLFPTSLIQEVFQRLNEARFSDKTKKAKKQEKQCDHGFHDYPSIAIHKIGGEKKQNVSYLNNSSRNGENWLLPSLPPIWRSERIRSPLHVTSIFRKWIGGQRNIRELLKALRTFLTPLSSTDYTNLHIRKTRADMVDHICDETLQLAAELHELEPGWSAEPGCKLDHAETLWLDPYRGASDDAFADEYDRGEWMEEVAHRFALWLNGQLRYKTSLHVGDAEHDEWKTVFMNALAMTGKERAHD